MSKYTVYTTEIIYRQFTVDTDDDLIAEHRREKLTGTDLLTDYDAVEVGDHSIGDLKIKYVEPVEHTAVRQSTHWWTDAWEGEPPPAGAMQAAGLSRES